MYMYMYQCTYNVFVLYIIQIGDAVGQADSKVHMGKV